jgi:hypothetical protein
LEEKNSFCHAIDEIRHPSSRTQTWLGMFLLLIVVIVARLFGDFESR